jgi:phosphoribosylformylglycinamidine synthase
VWPDAIVSSAYEALHALTLAHALGANGLTGFLFNEELGALIQIRRADRAAVMHTLAQAGLGTVAQLIGEVDGGATLCIRAEGREVYKELRTTLHRVWSATTFHLQTLRDNPLCAQQEYDRILDAADPGMAPHLTFDPAENIAAPFVHTARPRVAILREQGINGQIEMAAAFERAGFEAVDVHMVLSDLSCYSAARVFAAPPS